MSQDLHSLTVPITSGGTTTPTEFSVDYILDNLASAYSTSSTYAVGDYVIYNGDLYRCTTAITTAEAWTAAHWTAVKVGSELGEVKEDLVDLLKDYKSTSMDKSKTNFPISIKSKDGLTGFAKVTNFESSYTINVNILLHTTVVNGIKNDSGVDIPDTSKYWAEYTPVTPNEQLNIDYGAQRIYQYDANKNWLRRTGAHDFNLPYGEFVIPSDCYYIQIQFSPDTRTYNKDNPNVMRTVTVKEECESTTLTVSNKNILDKSSVHDGVKNDNGVNVEDPSKYYDKYIAVSPNETLFINFGAQRIYQYDGRRTWLRRTSVHDMNLPYGQFVVPPDCYYIQAQFATNSINLSNAQIERGVVETEYIQHSEHTYTFTESNNEKSISLYECSNISTFPCVEFEVYTPTIKSETEEIVIGNYDMYEPSEVTNDYSCTPLGQASQSIPNLTNVLKYKGFLDTYFNIYLGSREDGYSVTRIDLGLDSGAEEENHYANSIYSYEFKPKNYRKTVLLSAGMNTCEASTYFGLAYFIKELMEHTEDGMKALYDSTRFIVIPVICPSGIAHNPLLYPNSNNVKINKNFEYNGSWDRLKTDRGGSYPDSEVETKILKNWLNKYQGSDFYLDCHSDTSPSTIYKHLGTIFTSDSATATKLDSGRTKVINFYKNKGYISTSDNAVLLFGSLNKDTSAYPKTNYAYDICGIPSAMMEQFMYSTAWGSDGNTNNDAYAIKHYCTMIRYMVLEMCKD